jgi:glycosyltransferase involved in cell wall biosynthesis
MSAKVKHARMPSAVRGDALAADAPLDGDRVREGEARRPLRIVHFLSSTGHGGDALAALALARGQRLLGCEVEMAIGTTEHSRAFVERAHREGIAAVEVPTLPLSGGANPLKRLLAFRAALGRTRADVYHLHTGGLAVRALDVLGARLLPASTRVATVHWPFPWHEGSGATQRRWRRVSALLDAVICPSSTARAQQLAAGLPSDRVLTVPNGIDVERFEGADGQAVRRELGLDPGDPLVLFLARIEPQKRPLDAIAAFAAIAPRFPRARMLVVGRGDLEAACRDWVRDHGLGARISFAGYRTDVADLMRAADVYVLPTEYESFGLTLVEAMAAGVAIVTSRIAPICGEVVPEDCAAFVPVGDVTSLSQAIGRLVASPSLRADMTARARQVAKRRYTMTASAQRHLELYRALASRRRPAAAIAGAAGR